MTNIPFYKYQGTGNDFILIDHRQAFLQLSTQEIHAMCDRHFGIGADGLMLLEEAEGVDLKWSILTVMAGKVVCVEMVVDVLRPLQNILV